jgi:voltage-gated potassium channel
MNIAQETPKPAKTNAFELSQLSRLDSQLAPVMFWAGILYLFVLSMLLHLSEGRLDSPIGRGTIATLGIIWLAFPLEYTLQRLAGGRMRTSHLWAALLPWLRVAVRDHGRGRFIWLPKWGWVPVNRDLENRLHQAFTVPMMGVALLVLPLVSIEYIWSDAISTSPFWQKTIQAATGLIWTAFTLEFILMISVVKYKFNYVKRHWIDLIVVLLPIVSFLPALRLARLARLNQLGRTIRLYRVRGLLMRTWRAIVALEVIDRLIFRTPESRLQRMALQRFELQRELNLLDEKIKTYCEKYRLEHPRHGEDGETQIVCHDVLSVPLDSTVPPLPPTENSPLTSPSLLDGQASPPPSTPSDTGAKPNANNLNQSADNDGATNANAVLKHNAAEVPQSTTTTKEVTGAKVIRLECRTQGAAGSNDAGLSPVANPVRSSSLAPSLKPITNRANHVA